MNAFDEVMEVERRQRVQGAHPQRKPRRRAQARETQRGGELQRLLHQIITGTK